MRFKFKSIHKLHQTIYEKEIELDLSSAQLASGCWALEAVQAAADRSLLKPVQEDVPRKYERVMLGLATDTEWLRAARCSPEELTVEKVVIATRQVDKFVTDAGGTKSSKSQLSYHVRRLLKDFSTAKKVPRIERLNVMYRTPHKGPKRGGRKMISDATSPGTETPHPVGAIPFTSAEDLRAKTEAKIAATLRQIEAAAVSELDEHAARSALLDRLLRPIEVEPALLSRIEQLCSNPEVNEPPSWLGAVAPAMLAAAYHRICSRALTGLGGARFHLTCHRGKDVVDWLSAQGYVVGYMDLGYDMLGSRLLDLQTLQACLVILQKHTGWNVNAVLEMGEAGIEPNGKGGYVIQGYKARIGEETPFVEILPSDEAPRRAIELLLDRLAAMRQLGWISSSEGRLWLNGRYARGGRLQQYVGWAKTLKTFIQKYGLPNFSAEQLRVEVLGLRGVEKGGLEAARHTAGHARLSTTASYLDQILLQRTNSAYSLEFERRLEGSVRFRMGTDKEFDVSKDLLYPIGDGTSCSDPRNPPDPAFLDRAICPGKECHRGAGCANRRLVFDEDRIEEVFRTKCFYEENWRDLQSGNRDQFVALHLPAMLVNLALVQILEKSAYRHIVKQIQEGVCGEIKEK